MTPDTLKFRARLTENGKPICFYQRNQYLLSYLRRVTSIIEWGKPTDEQAKQGVHEKYLPKPLEEYLDLLAPVRIKNGVEIYEGDIVAHRDKSPDGRPYEHKMIIRYGKYEIEEGVDLDMHRREGWYAQHAGFSRDGVLEKDQTPWGNYDLSFSYFGPANVEKIGTEWENPELIPKL